MNRPPSRRRFLQDAATLGATLALCPALRGEERKPGPNDRLNLGIIGVNGRGAQNLAAVESENIVALCDVDTNRAAQAREKYPHADFYQDFRRLLDRKDLDAVVISVPDHMHAIPAVQAMRAGKHVYCEKPLAHCVHEVRMMMEVAAKQNVVTQIGTQMHAYPNYARVVEIVRAGVIGSVERVHVWCEKKPRVVHKAKQPLPVPAGFDYDLWLGWPPLRKYDPAHTHLVWRWWWDFGGGILTDMGCHFTDLPFWSLDLTAPTTVRATLHDGPEGDYDVPARLSLDYTFPAHPGMPPVHLTWYSGMTGPDPAGNVRYNGFNSGILFEGTTARLIADQTKYKLLPEERFKDFAPPKQTIPESVGHHREWIDAIKNGGKPSCNFASGGPLAETVLLGNVALRCGEAIDWDAKTGRVTNTKSAEKYLRKEYRKGWSL